jgi:hypothetical protein
LVVDIEEAVNDSGILSNASLTFPYMARPGQHSAANFKTGPKNFYAFDSKALEGSLAAGGHRNWYYTADLAATGGTMSLEELIEFEKRADDVTSNLVFWGLPIRATLTGLYCLIDQMIHGFFNGTPPRFAGPEKAKALQSC